MTYLAGRGADGVLSIRVDEAAQAVKAVTRTIKQPAIKPFLFIRMLSTSQ
jgi:hypothetical protein